MSENKGEKSVTVENMFSRVFAEIQEMKKDFGKVIKEDRKQIDKITTSLNQLNAAVTAANTAQVANPGKGKKRNVPKGLEGFLNSLGKGIEWAMKNPDKIFGDSNPQNSIIKANEGLYKKMIKKNLENSMKLSDLTVKKLENEVKRSARVGWNL